MFQLPLWLLVLMPIVFSGLCGLMKTPRQVLAAVIAGAGLFLVLAAVAIQMIISRGVVSELNGWLYGDSLSAFHLLVLSLVFFVSSIYSGIYFGAEIRAGGFSISEARKFGMLWFGSMAAMAMVLICGNLGLMWVGIEATTLVTAFLICTHVKPLALEAMWKYLVVCSVGVAFAFVGTLLVGASAQKLGLSPSEMMLWPRLYEKSALLEPRSMKLAFIFLLVGYGTKAGLAPMHTWLPDAHSQAPAPVSAIFSGFLLCTAMYCIMRYLPLVEASTGFSGWGAGMLKGLGLLSIVVAVVFIALQKDSKRLLAYSSVEHLGIIALGLGLGGAGVFAALWHVLNHGLAKSLAFFSAGRLGQINGSNELSAMAGSINRAGSRVWGLGLNIGLLALVGVAPFAIFMSELQVVKAAIAGRAYVSLAVFIAGTCVVFVVVARHAIAIAWGERAAGPEAAPAGAIAVVLVVTISGALLLLGVWLPESLWSTMEDAARIVRGGR